MPNKNDPLYGISNDYEGGRQASEQPFAVYQVADKLGKHVMRRELQTLPADKTR